VNSVPFLLIGIPAAIARLAQRRSEKDQLTEPTVEYAEIWPFDEIRARHPWLGEMDVRP